MFKRVADKLISVIDNRLPSWGAPRVEAVAERARDELLKVATFTGQVKELVELFKPFTTDHDIAFRCDNMRALWARVLPADQDKLLWAPHLVDWRKYWLDTHFPGLHRWTFDKLDEEFGAKPKSVYTYKELVELFEATVKLHRNRPALRLLRKDGGEPSTYTYGQMGDLGWMGAGVLRQLGIGPSHRVILMSENRPEWGLSYFAIVLVRRGGGPARQGSDARRGREPRAGEQRARDGAVAQGRRAPRGRGRASRSPSTTPTTAIRWSCGRPGTPRSPSTSLASSRVRRG